jgi:hypothetical protein
MFEKFPFSDSFLSVMIHYGILNIDRIPNFASIGIFNIAWIFLINDENIDILVKAMSFTQWQNRCPHNLKEYLHFDEAILQ